MIDTTKLKDTNCFFKLRDLLEELDLDLPAGAGQHIRGAFLCLHRTPIDAIVDKRSPGEVRAGEFLFSIYKIWLLIDSRSKRETTIPGGSRS